MEALLRRQRQLPLAAVVIAVVNEPMSPPGEDGITLILDDYHRIDAPQVRSSVAFLLDRLPPGLR